MPDATANIWFADEPDSHEQRGTKTTPRRIPEAAKRPRTKTQLKKNFVSTTCCSTSTHSIIPCGQEIIALQPANRRHTKKESKKNGLAQSALSYMTCPPTIHAKHGCTLCSTRSIRKRLDANVAQLRLRPPRCRENKRRMNGKHAQPAPPYRLPYHPLDDSHLHQMKV